MAPKRARSIDIANLASTTRMSGMSLMSRYTVSDRGKSLRPRNFITYSLQGVRQLKPQQTDYRIRTSVADLVLKELEAYNRCIFYQRVFILAKNTTLTVSAEPSAETFLLKDSIGENPTEPDNTAEETVEENTDFPEVDLQNKDESGLKSTKASIVEQPIKEKEKKLETLDFFDEFKDKVEIVVRKCLMEQLSEDRFTGLFLCMGNSHTLFVLEGPEDTIASFCKEILNLSSQYFEAMRVFLVEDKIDETYFDEFLYRRSVAMNINEKFPPPTANDPQLMGSQHWIIKEKIRILCQTLSQQIRPKPEPKQVEVVIQPVVQIEEEEKKPKRPKRKTKHRKRPKSPITAIGIESKRQTEAAVDENAEDPEFELQAPLQDQVEDEPPPPAEPIEAVKEVKEEIQLPLDARKTEEVDFMEPIAVVVGADVEEDVPENVPEDTDGEQTLPPLDLKPYYFNPSVFNRLLPEVQRIDLVLTSNRFYLDLPKFVPFSQEIPMQPDEDADIWPTSFSYLPVNVFKRLEYDVNLTFGNYDVKETEGDTDTSEDEEKDENEEGHGDHDKKES